MSGLADRALVVPPPGTPPLMSAEIAKYRALVAPAWELASPPPAARLVRTVRCADASAAEQIAARLRALADQVDHHPELEIAGPALTISIWTRSSGGLTSADFVFAAKADRLLAG